MENIYTLGATYGLKIIAAIAIFFIGKKIARLATIGSIKALKKSGIDETLEKFLTSTIYGLLLAVVVLVALGQIGIETTSIIAILGAVGLAIGLAFKDSLSNISAGIMIIIFKPIKIAENVEAGGANGIVEDINLFHTILKTADNTLIIIANSNIINKNIINYSRKAARRIELKFPIKYHNDIKKVKEILEKTTKNSAILPDPKPFVGISELNEEKVIFTLHVWVKNENYTQVYYGINEEAKILFDANAINY